MMSKRTKLHLLILLFVINLPLVKAQIDNCFWFAAPDISNIHGIAPANGAPIMLNISAVNSTTVTVSRPADPSFVPMQFDLAQSELRSIRLDEILPIDEIETYAIPDPNSGIQAKGFLITSYPGDISVYYELNNNVNQEVFSLKGDNALGNEFWVATQNTFPNGVNYSDAYSGLVIVATQDNTSITVYSNGDLFGFSDPAPIVINLNRGETFAFRANGKLAGEHLEGVRVTADKEIAITVFDDSIRKKNIESGSCSSGISYDLVGDQSVPVSHVGNVYLVQKGEIADAPLCDGGERVFIHSTEAATTVFANGVWISVIENPGELIPFQLFDDNTLIEADKPIYVFHLSGIGGEMGGAILPAIDLCNASNTSSFVRSLNPNDQLRINLSAKNDTSINSIYRNQAIHNFTLSTTDTEVQIPPHYFEYFMDSAYIVLTHSAEVDAFLSSIIAPGDIVRIKNNMAGFHLGVIQGTGNSGVKYASFTNFSNQVPSAGIGGSSGGNMYVSCNEDSVLLVASGGLGYAWKCISHPQYTRLLSDSLDAAPWFDIPEGIEDSYTFQVIIEDGCQNADTFLLQILNVLPSQANFSISSKVACAGEAPTLTVLSNPATNENMRWIFENPFQEVDQDTMPVAFNWNLPVNLSDTLQLYFVTLQASREYNLCPSGKRDTIRILPSVIADFEYDLTYGCNEAFVQLTNNSNGSVESYEWELGMGVFSTDPDPLFSYPFTQETDTSLYIGLYVTSAHGCSDSAYSLLHIKPQIENQLLIDAMEGCSPFNPLLSVSAPGDADSILWYFTTMNDNLEIIADSSVLNHKVLINETAITDTVSVQLLIMNSELCWTEYHEQILVHPEVNADIGMSDLEGCAPFQVQFNNQSSGASDFHWNFGNGIESGEFQPSTIYETSADHQENFICWLYAMNPHCSIIDSSSVEITVKSRIKLNLNIDESEGCSPLTTELTATDFGDLDSVIYFIFYPDNLDSVARGVNEAYNFQHQNLSNTNDTIAIRTIPYAGSECIASTDTFIIVYPQVIADFELEVGDDDYPVTVSSVNNSLNATFYQWDLGDGNYSNSENITHTYLAETDTLYVLQLMASNSLCEDAAEQEIFVLPPALDLPADDPSDGFEIFYSANTDQLVVTIGDEKARLETISVYSINGSLLQQGDPHKIISMGKTYSISLNNLPHGKLYIVVLSIDGKLIHSKIFKPC